MILVYNFVVVQLDVKTAFLNGELEEAVWVMSPKGIPGRPSRLYRLRKAIYGLNKAHLAWHRNLCFVLSELGLTELKSAPCVFVKRVGDAVMYVMVYVDGLLIVSSCQSMWRPPRAPSPFIALYLMIPLRQRQGILHSTNCYHTFTPRTAVRVKFHHMGKFQTDTLSQKYSYHTSWYDTGSSAIYTVTSSPEAMVEEGQETATQFYPR